MKHQTLSATTPARPVLSRRRLWLRSFGAAAAAWILGPATRSRAAGPAVRRGRIRQSIVHWPFEAYDPKWDVERSCRAAKELGCSSVELVDPKYFPILRRYGLKPAICQIDMNPDPPFLRGWNNPDHWPRLMKATRDAIDAAASIGSPNVICFTGFSAKDPADPNSPHLSREEGARNCVEGLKRILPYAEKNRVTLCLEILNTRDTTHPMKGHPGYQGNDTEYCLDIIKRVGSPHLKLLFDIYHVQVMNGDLIRRIRQHHEYIGHVHTAGNPGRNEIGADQEINYPAVMKALVEVGYQGYVGQEFIPTRDPMEGLREAVSLCDV
ncbi:MAG: hydroxypyruvate isomerase [Verrucomicrobia bacterium]|nr:MAG: hydroxypyruvate isomerase [Verrucomicrobiota bacterium]